MVVPLPLKRGDGIGGGLVHDHTILTLVYRIFVQWYGIYWALEYQAPLTQHTMTLLMP